MVLELLLIICSTNWRSWYCHACSRAAQYLFLRSVRFWLFLERSSTSTAITIVSKHGIRYQFQFQLLEHWRFNLSFNSNSCSIQGSIATTISVAISTECNFSFDSGSCSVYNSITVTISVAVGVISNFDFDSGSCRLCSSITATISVTVGAICNFNLDSGTVEFTFQSQLQRQ